MPHEPPSADADVNATDDASAPGPGAGEAALLTLSDWRAAALAGARPGPLLRARLQRLAARPALPDWLLRLDAAALQGRLDELDALAAACSTAAERQALLQRLPLFGVPFAVKDNIDVAGLPTTAACPAWAHAAAASATVVRKLLDAGAVLLGKTNLDQFATGLVGTRSPYGAPQSTLAPGHVSGGSSSGSAVVVARGEVAFALGTDTAGSGRIPAGFNQLVGLKPTPGRISTAGVLPACRSLDCVSIFALTVDDAAAVLAVAEGPDAADDYSAWAPGPARLGTGRPLRVGLPRQRPLDADQGYDSAWAAAVGRLQAGGAQCTEIDFEPLFAIARLLYDGPWVAERTAAVEPLLARDPAAFDPTVAGIVRGGLRYGAVDTFRAQYALQAARAALARLWDEVDLLLVPTAPRHPTLAEVAADPVGGNAVLGTYTNFVNLLGWCALALPAGRTPTGLPFGVTAIARGGFDAALAAWGRQWQAALALPLGATGRAWGDAAAPLPLPATAPTLALAVVGAHLSGLPLNHQLLALGATLRCATTTAPCYRLYALPGTTPPKPGLLRVAEGGAAIAVEVWDVPLAGVGAFLAGIPAPLGLGTLSLADGSALHGFLCEAVALQGARDITHHGGWRAFLAAA